MREYVGKHSKRADPERRAQDQGDLGPPPGAETEAEFPQSPPGPAGHGAPGHLLGIGATSVAGLPPAVPRVTSVPPRPAAAAGVAVLDPPAAPSQTMAFAPPPPGVVPDNGAAAATVVVGADAVPPKAPVPPPVTVRSNPRLLPSPVREKRYKARRWVRTGGFAFLILILVLSGGAYAAYVYGEDVWRSIPIDETVSRDGVLDAPVADEPVTVLLVGSDTRDLQDPDAKKDFGSAAKVGGQRSDTMMLFHVDPKAGHTWVLSLPRDLKVNIPGHGTQKINAAFNWGPDVLVETIKGFTGIPVNHYVEVNFESFVGIVDALGGYEVCLDGDTRDTVLLWKLSAGCHQLDGQAALQYVRSRHYQQKDPTTGKWKGEGDGDMGRIKRQQEFMLNMASRLAGPGSLSNLGEYQSIAQQYLKLDSGFDFGTALSLFRTMTPLSPDKVEFVQVEWGNETGKDGAAYIIPTQQGLAEIARLRADAGGVDPATTAPGAAPAPAGAAATPPASAPPPGVTPASVSVKVLNASGNAGLASRMRVHLRTLGYEVVGIGDNPKKVKETQVLQAGGNEAKAELLAGQLGYGAVQTGSADGADVVLVLGSDAKEPK